MILKDGANDFATFYGYYMLEALAKAGKYQEAMDIISDYWGAMLDLGATTFWENFVYAERVNATRIDQLSISDKFDIHADGGAHCYIGLRGQSLSRMGFRTHVLAHGSCIGNQSNGAGIQSDTNPSQPR